MSTICVLSPYHWDAAKGGSEYRARVLAERLAESRENRVVYLARFAPTGSRGYAYELATFRGPSAFSNPKWGMVPDAVALYKALCETKPDVIVQFVACALTGVAAYYARRYGAAMVWCIASDMDVELNPNVGVSSPIRILDRSIFRYGMRNATTIIAQTEYQRDALAENTNRTVDAIVPNFHPMVFGPVRKNDRLTVLWIANLKPNKRPEMFLDLAERLQGNKNIVFTMMGRPDPSPWGGHIVSRMHDLPNVEYVGELEMEEVNGYLERAHVLVNTSLKEGLSNTFIQAWLREVIVISSNVDPDEVIANRGLGFLLSSIEEIASVLDSLAKDRSSLGTMGAKCRAYAEERFSMRNLEELVSIVQSAAKN